MSTEPAAAHMAHPIFARLLDHLKQNGRFRHLRESGGKLIDQLDARMEEITSSMRDAISTLTEREKETLRLLLVGHDAKSIARDLGLSVHTINERLRDARRKLGVASSREAARLLAEAEQVSPKIDGDKLFGVSGDAANVPSIDQPGPRLSAAHRLAWLGGGLFIMSLIIAAVALSSAFQGSATSEAAGGSSAAVSDSHPAAAASLGSARQWLDLLDRQSWEQSWRTAADLFRSQITAPQWTAMVQSVRQPLGSVSSRTFQSVTKASSLPGCADGRV